MKKKTILFMAHIPPPVHGAALRNKSLLESNLLNSKFNIIALPLRFIDNMKDIHKFSFNKLWIMIRYAFQLTKILLTKKIDLVYFTMSPGGGAFYRDILFITIIKLFKKKRILHFRVKGIQKTSRSSLGELLIRYAFKGSEIVCLSHHHMLDVKGLTFNTPFIVPNGIKVENDFLYLADEYVYTSGKPPQILFLSNLSKKKGVPELIQALASIKNEGYHFSSSLVGSEWDLSFADISDMINKSKLDGIVKIEGPKYGKEKFSFIAGCDIFVFPTYFELFPGVILEAMQFGKAIVSTFEGSIPEIIDNNINGILVEQQNTTQLANAIKELLNDDIKRKKMGIEAKNKFFRDFTLSEFENKMLDVFETVINK